MCNSTNERIRGGQKVIYKFEIPKRLIGLNEYTNANRYNKYAGAKQKREEQDFIKICILQKAI